jgi:hypothetical protein
METDLGRSSIEFNTAGHVIGDVGPLAVIRNGDPHRRGRFSA